MAFPVKMPQRGLSEESCIITKWHKKKGDIVNAGDPLFTIETGKSTFDVEAEANGTLIGIFYDEGSEVPVSSYVCAIGNHGESFEGLIPGNGASGSNKIGNESNIHDNAAIGTPADSLPIRNDGNKPKISPRAKKLADKLGVDYRLAIPTGPKCRIVEKDILAMMDKGPFITSAAMDRYLKSDAYKNIPGTGLGGRIRASDIEKLLPEEGLKRTVRDEESALYEEASLSNIRKAIAKNMHHSLSSTAQLTLNISFDASEILAYRKNIKAAGENLGLQNISINDIILFAVSRTLLNHRALNAHLIEDKMLLFKNVHLGVAVDTERGLMVPTVFNANLKSLNSISMEVKHLTESCRNGSISPSNLEGASFTVTNLGSFDIESFTPVLNPPQTGILGVNNITQRMKLIDDRHINYPAMGLSLTFDHRAVDGAPAARFLKDLTANLENFCLLLSI